jgi:hypothetical protein
MVVSFIKLPFHANARLAGLSSLAGSGWAAFFHQLSSTF